MKDTMKRSMYELFGVGGDEDRLPAEGGGSAVVTAPAAKAAPAQGAARPAVQGAEKSRPGSYLAAGTALEGTLRAEGDVEIAGSFKGEIVTRGTVTLRSDIESRVTAGSLKLAGCSLTGDVNIAGTVSVSEDSRITGNVRARELLCAGKINGDLEIGGSTALEEKACVNGAVVTGALAVVKGAALHGSVEIKTGAGDGAAAGT